MVAGGLLSSCQKEAPDVLPNPAPSEPEEVSIQSTIILSDRGVLTSKIKADTILRFYQSDLRRLYKIEARFYGTLGAEQARVTADSGTANEKTQFVQLWGNVKVAYANGTKIDGDSLKWDQANQKVATEGFVKIVKKDGTVLEGEGLTTDPQFDSYRLRKPKGAVKIPEEEGQ
jgi:LPS export ABC transporter protein LptC